MYIVGWLAWFMSSTKHVVILRDPDTLHLPLKWRGSSSW